MRIVLKEAVDLDDETIVSNDTNSSDELFFDVDLPEELSFIVSDELNELRDVLYNLDEDVHILLLNDDMVVLVKEDEENKSLLYCLTPDEEEFSFIELPMSISEIVANNNVIKYFPDQLNENHDKIIKLFKHLIPDSDEDVSEDDVVTSDEEITEDMIDALEDEVSSDNEEEDEDVKVNIEVK